MSTGRIKIEDSYLLVSKQWIGLQNRTHIFFKVLMKTSDNWEDCAYMNTGYKLWGFLCVYYSIGIFMVYLLIGDDKRKTQDGEIIK